MSELQQVNTRLQRMMRRVREEALEEGERRGLERGLREGFEEGERRGLERGLREGEQRGLERGLREGEQRGERRALRSALVAVLEARFGTMPQWARERIDAGSVEELDCWVRRAATAESVESVFEND